MKTTDDGTVEGHAEVADQGFIEMLDRTILASIPEGQEAVIASRVLASTGQAGSGKFDVGEPRKLSQPYTYSTNFTLPDLVHLPGPGAFTVPTGIHSMGAIAGIGLVTTLPERNFAMAGCADTSHREDYTLELPKGIRVTTVPKNASVKRPIGSYNSSYRLEGQTLHVTREMTTTTGTPTCSPAQYGELRAFALEIGKDLRAQILYQ
ncbi:MAG: DUF3858 domain-containing protein [Rudaea sp.]|uniref:DUF3858 domain-containing protein n=1 Tax=Rudaea sp. TaxID=2136325 RepID=UPI0039E276CD